MRTRIITSVLALLIAVPVIIFSGTVVFPLFLSFLCVVSVFEILRCVGYHRIYTVSIPALVLAVLFPMGAWAFTSKRTFILGAVILSYLLLFYLLCLSVLNRGKLKVADVCVAYTSTMYILVGFTSIVLLRWIENGQYLFMLAFVAAWMTDIFAYFVGCFFGKHKLIEEISPKKTVEGAIGGILFSALGYMLYGMILGMIVPVQPHCFALAAAGAFVSVISQFGDLIASLIKRQYGIKDYGKILPGHGGILDRFDSAIAVSPILLIVCSRPELFSLFM